MSIFYLFTFLLFHRFFVPLHPVKEIIIHLKLKNYGKLQRFGSRKYP